MCCTCKTSINQKPSVLFRKKLREKNNHICATTHRELHRVCTYCILHIPVENHKKFFEHTINDPVLVGTACKEKDRVWLNPGWILCTLYELKVPWTDNFCSITIILDLCPFDEFVMHHNNYHRCKSTSKGQRYLSYSEVLWSFTKRIFYCSSAYTCTWHESM